MRFRPSAPRPRPAPERKSPRLLLSGKAQAPLLAGLLAALVIAVLVTLGQLILDPRPGRTPEAKDATLIASRSEHGPPPLDPWQPSRVRRAIPEPGDEETAQAPDLNLRLVAEAPEASAGKKEEAPAVSTAPSPGPEPPAPPAEPLRIRAVTFERSLDGTESVSIQANGPLRPEVFQLDGKNPFGSSRRLVLDVRGVASVAEDASCDVSNGSIVRRVRTSYRRGSGTFRTVLDLDPAVAVHTAEETSSGSRCFTVRLKGEAKMVETEEPSLLVRSIVYEAGEEGGERILIRGDRFFEPRVFGVEGANPYGEDSRIVVDLPNTRPVKKGCLPADVNGRLVRAIRHHYHSDTQTLRLVLDLAPADTYEASQTFFQGRNLYCLVLSDGSERSNDLLPASGSPAWEDEAPAAVPETTPVNVAGPQEAHPKSPAKASGPLRVKGRNVSESDLQAALRHFGFHCTCGVYNADFCNQGGDFPNRFQKCGAEVVCDKAAGLMWQEGGSRDPLTRQEAEGFVLELNRTAFAGFKDWRMPTIEELLSLMEGSWRNEDLFIDEAFQRVQRSCWSIDTYGEERAWKAQFHLGYAMDASLSERNWVRAVRSLPGPALWTGTLPGEADDARPGPQASLRVTSRQGAAPAPASP